MDKLHISLIQSDLVWENANRNKTLLSEKLTTLKGLTDIVVLPEMFTTGFSMNPSDNAEEWPGKTLDWMKTESEKGQFALCGSIMVKEKEAFFNRFVWVDPIGNINTYDKRHLFKMGGEHEVYQAGKKHEIIEYKEWRIAPFICYDLRFPVWSRNANNYDLAIYVANWPAPRFKVWQKLLLARAIENQCYVVGVNRVGIDGRNLKYSGNSMIVDARGEPILELIQGVENIGTYEIDKKQLLNFRAKFPLLTDADKFEIQ